MPGIFSVLKGNFNDPMAVSRWIMENVPCFSGPVPKEWEQAVYREASVRHIHLSIVTFALSMTRKYGYQFSDSTNRSSRLNIEDLILRTTGPRVNAVDPARRRETSIATMKILDYKFGIASASGDGPEMQRLAQEFAKLLNAASPGELPEAEMAWGAPLIRRAIERERPVPRGGRRGDPSGGGPYRVASWVETGEIDEIENEAE